MSINNLTGYGEVALPLPKRERESSSEVDGSFKRRKMNSLKLPEDCWLEVFSFLEDHRAAAATCKVWKHYLNFIYIEKVAQYREDSCMAIYMPSNDPAPVDSSFKRRKMNPFQLPENCCWEVFRFLGDHRAAVATCKVWNHYLNFIYIDNPALYRKNSSMMIFIPPEDLAPSRPLLESERISSLSSADDYSINIIGAHCLNVLQKTYEQVYKSLHYPYTLVNSEERLPPLHLSPTAARVVNGNLIRFAVQIRADLCTKVGRLDTAGLEKLNNLIRILEPSLPPLGFADEQGEFVMDEERIGELEAADSAWDDSDAYVMKLSEVETKERADAIRGCFRASPELRELLLMVEFTDLCFTVMSPEIGLFSKLDTIYIDDNKITTIPPEIGKLSQLTTLLVSRNQLSELPENLSACDSLQQLYCDGNRLSSIPSSICNLPQLKELDLANNRLTFLPANFGNLKNLEDLNLSNNQLEDVPGLSQLAKLKLLNLAENRFSKFPEGMGNLINLEKLNFSDNHLVAIPVEGRNWIKLKNLNLDENRFSFDENRAFPSKLAFGSGIQGGSLMDRYGFWPSLEELRIANNGLSQVPPIFELLTASKNLKTLDLSYNNIQRIPNWLIRSSIDYDLFGNERSVKLNLIRGY